MSQPALQLVGADMGQAGAGQAHETASELVREAQRLAELAGAFALFGLNICLEAGAFETADQVYRADEAPVSEPANDVGQAVRAFPKLQSRGLHLSPTMPIRLLQAVDWILLAAAAEFAARWGAGESLAGLPLAAVAAFALSALGVKAGLWLTEFYRVSPAHMRAERGLGGLALGAILGVLAANFLAPDARAAAALAATLPVTAMLLAGVHAALAIWTNAAYRAGAFAETVVLVGATDAAARLSKRGRSGETRIVAIVDDRLSRAPSALEGAPVGGDIDALLAWEGLPHVDRIVITVTQKAEARVRDMIAKLRFVPNRVDLLLDYDTSGVRGRGVDRLASAPTACVSGRPRNHSRALVKRAQDLIIGSLLLAVFALPMLVIAIAVKADSKGPVLYRQRRHGFNNRIITILKFRSMRHDPEAPLRQVEPNDARITRVGRMLRSKSLDELPQLINVLRGEMSLVGPRPHAVGMKAADRELAHIVAEYAHRHRVKPGITGWAQVNGSRGPVDSPQAVRRRVKLDLEYVARASLWFDLQIVLRTAPTLFGDHKVIR